VQQPDKEGALNAPFFSLRDSLLVFLNVKRLNGSSVLSVLLVPPV